MNLNHFNTLSEIIKARRAVFPKSYDSSRDLSNETILAILENANWAPTHKKTEPWRFVVIKGDSREKLAHWLAEDYKRMTKEPFSEVRYNKMKENPLLSACVIAIVMQKHPESGLPEWEEVAAVACAVQNIWLSASSLGIGSYWSSPGTINRIGEFLQLEENQVCLGLYYMGYIKEGLAFEGVRKDIADKIRWM